MKWEVPTPLEHARILGGHTDRLSTIQPTPAARLFRGRRLGIGTGFYNRERDEGLRCSLNGRLLFPKREVRSLTIPNP